MKKKNIKSLEMVRTIRDNHFEKLKSKNKQERILFYKSKAQKLYKEVGINLT